MSPRLEAFSKLAEFLSSLLEPFTFVRKHLDRLALTSLVFGYGPLVSIDHHEPNGTLLVGHR